MQNQTAASGCYGQIQLGVNAGGALLQLKLIADGCNVTSSGYVGANCTGAAVFTDSYPTVSDS